MKRYGFLLALTLPLMVVAGYLLGGAWNYATIVFSYAFLPLLDLWSGHERFQPSRDQILVLEKDPWYRGVLYVGAALQFALLVFGAWVVTHAAMSGWALAGFILSVGTCSGSIGIVIAHELGHHVSEWDRMLSRALLVSVCYMHFYVEHNRGHHSQVATPEDAASARYGENLYLFLPRTLLGSWIHAWRLEQQRLAKSGVGAWRFENAMLWCVIWPTLLAAALGLSFGAAAVWYFLLQAGVAVVLLEAVNYIEHYALERRLLPDGSREKVSVVHSWNSSQRLSGYFLFNLTRHSHHHIQAQRHYQTLAHEEASPQMPAGYAGMLVLAFLPPLWGRVMHPRLAAWRASLGHSGGLP